MFEISESPNSVIIPVEPSHGQSTLGVRFPLQYPPRLANVPGVMEEKEYQEMMQKYNTILDENWHPPGFICLFCCCCCAAGIMMSQTDQLRDIIMEYTEKKKTELKSREVYISISEEEELVHAYSEFAPFSTMYLKIEWSLSKYGEVDPKRIYTTSSEQILGSREGPRSLTRVSSITRPPSVATMPRAVELKSLEMERLPGSIDSPNNSLPRPKHSLNNNFVNPS
eukprot:TRINITY_DN4222_c0_g1_i1.p1 TRINITY_DN4222_c0_g1~~TRINITY_DN4222_c0_g1_i1.p1  ORF type:complete len:225 (-),score=36.48 TRINITY_DN4222_c0_g1_i1:74-748(-)